MPSLTLTLKEGGYVWIAPRAKTSDAYQYVLDKIKKIPVISFDKKHKKFVSSIYYLDDLYEICRHNGWEVFVSDALDEYHERFKARLKRIYEVRKDTSFQSELWNPEHKLDDYQAQAVNTAFYARRWLIGDDMGVGKTIELIGIMCKAFDCDYNKALVVVLNRLKRQWRDEILKFTKLKPEDVSIIDPYAKFKCPLQLTDVLDLRSNPCKSCERKDKCAKERNDPILKAKAQLEYCKIAIVNYESLDRIKDLVVKMGFDILGCDEASKAKNPQSQMAKALKFISSKLPQHSIIVMMSGTFIENVCHDIFTSFRTIDARILGEWYNFKNRFLITDYWGNITGFRKKKLLRQIIDNNITRRKLSDVWKGPPLKEEVVMCEMEEEQRLIYENAKRGTLKDLSDLQAQKKVNIADIGPLLNYLMQIADTPETIDPKIKNASCKIEMIKDLLEHKIPKYHKVIIFSFFGNKVVPILERELNKLKMGKVLTITGQVKEALAEHRKKLFKTSKDHRLLVCSDAMGYGANMQEATVVINMDLPWNPAKLDQRIARVYRRGQTNKVYVYNLVTEGTVDERIMEKLGEKRKLFDDLLGGRGIKKSIGLAEMLQMLQG